MPAERIDGLVAVLDAIRSGTGTTQPQLIQQVALGRTVVAQRVAELEAAGLVVTEGHAPSTGGRAPRRLRLRQEAGLVAGVDIGATGMVVGVADLTGNVLSYVEEASDVADGPEVVLSRVEELIEEVVDKLADPPSLWGIGLGVPGPVEFATGLPVAPPIMPGWDGYPIRERLSSRFAAPVWVDNDVNLLALGELRSRPAAEVSDMIYVKIGTGIGAGLVPAAAFTAEPMAARATSGTSRCRGRRRRLPLRQRRLPRGRCRWCGARSRGATAGGGPAAARCLPALLETTATSLRPT